MIPTLSVIVPSVNGWADLGPTLAALEAEATRPGQRQSIETIVVDRIGESIRQHVRQDFPEVTIVATPEGVAIPPMRARGIAVARAPLIAIIEDHVRVPAGWADAMADAQKTYGGVIAGTVYNAATDSIVDWAAFFCEYNQLLPIVVAGRADALPGNNTVYPRELLDPYRAMLEAGSWEDDVHRAMREAGVPLTIAPDISAAHARHYTCREYLEQRVWYARAFAGRRLARRGWLARWVYALAAMTALPMVLFGRVVGRSWQARAHRAALVRATPLIALFVCAWGAGEALGAIGGASDALARVR